MRATKTWSGKRLRKSRSGTCNGFVRRCQSRHSRSSSSTNQRGGKRRRFTAGPDHAGPARPELFGQDRRQQGCGWRGRDSFGSRDRPRACLARASRKGKCSRRSPLIFMLSHRKLGSDALRLVTGLSLCQKRTSTLVAATTYIHVKIRSDLPERDPPNPPNPLCGSPDSY